MTQKADMKKRLFFRSESENVPQLTKIEYGEDKGLPIGMTRLKTPRLYRQSDR